MSTRPRVFMQYVVSIAAGFAWTIPFFVLLALYKFFSEAH